MKNFFSLILFLASIFFLILFVYFSPFRIDLKILGVDESNLLKINFLDVGQGDAILIRTPGGQDILIDGGPDNRLVNKLGQYLPFYDRTIELVILTHPHSDHLVGLIEVLKRYQVKEIMMTGVIHPAPDYLAWLALIEKKRIPVKIIDQPQEIVFEENLLFSIFSPLASFFEKRADNLNNTSIVGKLIYGRTSFLFTGDFEEEEKLIEAGFDLRADVYKAGHHGSKNANDLSFVRAVAPAEVVISVGRENQFNHPHLRTLKNFQLVGARVWRTDLMGDISFISNGESIWPAL